LRAILLTLLACGAPGRSGGDSGADPAAAQAAALAELLEQRRGWGQVRPGIVPGDHGHGDFVQTWWNDEALASTPDIGLQPGAVVTKEAYADAEGTTLLSLAAITQPGPGADEPLFFAIWAPDGRLRDAGRPDGCVDCHLKGDNWLYYWP
jgi:hypothetical protein